jgi:hypothetical protein
MRSLRQVSIYLSLSLVVLCACKARMQAATTQTQTAAPPTPLTRVDGPQGGKIVYGSVPGAATQPAALANLLDGVQAKCGEKPQIGRVFQFRGTNSVGVFFTVTDHRTGSKMAGLTIATATGPNQVEAALLSNDAARFGQTVNPMLEQLFGKWHPGGQAAASRSSSGDGHSASSARLHTVTASDNSASIGIAEGWQLDPHSASSTMVLNGPNGELAVYAANKPAVDPYNPQQVQAVRYGIYNGSGTMLYPYHQDLGKAYPELLQAWRRANNASPAKLEVHKIEPINPPKEGGSCVVVTGHIDADGQGMKKLIDDICQYPPAQWGAYFITRNFEIMTDAQFEQEHKTVIAMFMSARINQQVMNQQMQQKLQQKQQSDQQWRAWGQQQSDRIRAQGEAAQRNFAAHQAADDAQHAGYWSQQSANAAQHAEWNEGQVDHARYGQGFSNYILDQTVVQANFDDGSVGHGTVSNTFADALVKADPNRFEIVDTPNYWLGTDFHR